MAGSYKNRCKMLDSKTCGGNTVKIVVNTWCLLCTASVSVGSVSTSYLY